jgi:hypothetical protein
MMVETLASTEWAVKVFFGFFWGVFFVVGGGSRAATATGLTIGHRRLSIENVAGQLPALSIGNSRIQEAGFRGKYS